MSNIPDVPERNAPDPILPEPISEDGLVQPDDSVAENTGHAPPPPIVEDKPTPGDQQRPMTDEEELDEALEETFPGSDPIAPKRIDGPL